MSKFFDSVVLVVNEDTQEVEIFTSLKKAMKYVKRTEKNSDVELSIQIIVSLKENHND